MDTDLEPVVVTAPPRYWFAERPRSAGHGFPVIVFGPDGNLDLPLTLFAREVDRRLAHGTARTYLYAILPFFTFLTRDAWQQAAARTWDSPPSVVRQAVEAYLEEDLGCRVRVHRLGFNVVTRSARSPRTVHVFLSALKLFYRVMRMLGLYAAAHPMVDALAVTASDILAYTNAGRGPPPMPSLSGVQAPRRAPTYRLSDSYFRLQGEEWIPQVVDDASLPQRLREGGHALPGWGMRDECVLNLLFESGARTQMHAFAWPMSATKAT